MAGMTGPSPLRTIDSSNIETLDEYRSYVSALEEIAALADEYASYGYWVPSGAASAKKHAFREMRTEVLRLRHKLGVDE